MSRIKSETETFYVDFLPFVVEFSIDGKGINAFDAAIEIYSIDGKPEGMYSEYVIEKIIEDIRIHAFKDPEINRESQAEARGDESRNN